MRAEEQALRRLERDLHDGPQQGLIRMQMDLDLLGRRIARGETVGAEELAAETRNRTQAVLDELRALSAGVAPPLLADRGLAAALTALAAAAPVPVTVRLDPGLDAALGPEVARTVDFTIAELLTSIAKHAGVSQAWLEADLLAGPHGTAAVTVTGDGRVRGAAAPRTRPGRAHPAPARGPWHPAHRQPRRGTDQDLRDRADHSHRRRARDRPPPVEGARP